MAKHKSVPLISPGLFGVITAWKIHFTCGLSASSFYCTFLPRGVVFAHKTLNLFGDQRCDNVFLRGYSTINMRASFIRLSSNAFIGGRPLRLADKVAVPSTFNLLWFFWLHDAHQVITGAGGGIGRASATLFAREGAKIVCADLNRAAAEETAKKINEAAGKNIAVACEVNVANPAQVEGMIKTAEKTFGKLDILFNNAGL